MPSLAAASVQDERDVVCFCEWVTREEIVATIPLVRNVKELRDRTRACMTCFGCEGDLDELVAEHHALFGTACHPEPARE
jgi:NAD(P)H-nitrite reductase large subunit